MKQVIVERRVIAGKRYGGTNQRGLNIDERQPIDEAPSEERPPKKVVEKKKEEKREPKEEEIKWVPVKRKKYFFLDCRKAIATITMKKDEGSALHERLYDKFVTGLRQILAGKDLNEPIKFNVIASGYILNARDEGGFIRIVQAGKEFALPSGLYQMCETAMSNIFPLPRRVSYK